MTPEEQKEFEKLEEFEKILDSYCEMQMKALGSTDSNLRAGLEDDFKSAIAESGMSPSEFMDHVKLEADKKNQEAADAELAIHNAEKKAAEEKLAKEQAEKEAADLKAEHDKKDEAQKLGFSKDGMYKALKRFYAVLPCEKNGHEKIIVQIGDSIKGEHISQEHFDRNLVKRIK